MSGKSLFWPTVITFSGLLILLALGTWQMQRLAWKNGLNDTVRARTTADAVPLPAAAEWQGLDLDTWEYRPVTTRGRFDHEREVHVFTQISAPRGRFNGPGYWVITPFVVEGGGIVMVNRGFVPARFKEAATRMQGQVTGLQSVVGLFRKPDRQAFFVPDNNYDDNLWYFRDIGAMARASGAKAQGQTFASFILDDKGDPGGEGAPGGLPQAGETRLAFKNDHLQYAITWYALALCLIGVYIAYAWKSRERK